MKCPECKTKITTKHYDAEFQWYECPKCEGCFTADEIEEAASGTSPGKRAKEAKKEIDPKPERGLDEDKKWAGIIIEGKGKPVAKGKKRQTEIHEDEEAAAKHEAEMLKPVKSNDPASSKHKDDVSFREVVNIMADEIQAFYEELGGRIDEMNAQDKALTIWRQMRIDTGVSAREQEVSYVMCSEHS